MADMNKLLGQLLGCGAAGATHPTFRMLRT